jgi:hypothetical protein
MSTESIVPQGPDRGLDVRRYWPPLPRRLLYAGGSDLDSTAVPHGSLRGNPKGAFGRRPTLPTARRSLAAQGRHRPGPTAPPVADSSSATETGFGACATRSMRSSTANPNRHPAQCGGNPKGQRSRALARARRSGGAKRCFAKPRLRPPLRLDLPTAMAKPWRKRDEIRNSIHHANTQNTREPMRFSRCAQCPPSDAMNPAHIESAQRLFPRCPSHARRYVRSTGEGAGRMRVPKEIFVCA